MPEGNRKVLVANRGEVVRRVARACRELGLTPVVVFTDADALSLPVLEASHKVCLGPDPKEYTNAAKLVAVAKAQGCCAVHPGYGFLSENAEFAEALEGAGIAFLGPTAATMRMFSRKHTAREYAQKAGVPVLPGSSLVTDEAAAVKEAKAAGFPVLLKATGGGGGIGIYTCRDEDEVCKQFAAAGRQGQSSFGDAGVFVEKLVQQAHHIEAQIFGDGHGQVLVLPLERECSIQRRHQKVVEESPAPLTDTAPARFRQDILAAAQRLGEACSYRSAGTVEFLVDETSGKFYFLEMNTRLQVEHGITELTCQVDLVHWMLRLGVPGLQAPDLRSQHLQPKGHAIEVRINAEDPFRNFGPSVGQISNVAWPDELPGLRVDTWIDSGTTVTPHYDSLLAKLMVLGSCRSKALQKLHAALDKVVISGIPSNLEYLRAIAASYAFASVTSLMSAGKTTTKFLEGLPFTPRALEVITPGINTSVQDWPGRTGMWGVGVPPSGPMDALSFRLVNALVGNEPDAAGLEMALEGPKLKVHAEVMAAVGGAAFEVLLDGKAQPLWTSFVCPAGSTLQIGKKAAGPGARCYLAVSGGLDTPVYLGSRSTFPSGKLGGVQGRFLRPGDQLPLGKSQQQQRRPGVQLPEAWRPAFPSQGSAWTIGVLPGPNAAPDYFTPEDIDTLHSSAYEVHYNSNRLGIRLNGPKPKFARSDGGQGGSHPSNVHDHVYAVGTLNFTGDMPVVITNDGPSLGGFVCPATITSAQLWKAGQVSPLDTVRFQLQTLEDVHAEMSTIDSRIAAVQAVAVHSAEPSSLQQSLSKRDTPRMPSTQAVLHRMQASKDHPGAILRLAGDRCLFVEYGPMELDLNLRVRVHELQNALTEQKRPGLVELCPGVRSCLIEYEPRKLSLLELLDAVKAADARLLPATELTLSSRVLRLPLAFQEQWTKAAIQKYMRSVRPEGPYLPSNIDFVAANNGLSSPQQVKETVFKASYMVLGLGDVFLGAPCAVPVDPRHRLTVPKYNPARTFTPEGAVGIGGCYMCIYPMESPGGYQLIGRTLPIWNSFGRIAPFSPDKPWLLRIFDQVQFYEVPEEDLEQLRKEFAAGQLALDISEQSFSLKEYNAMLASVQSEVEKLSATQARCVKQQTELDVASLQRIRETQPSMPGEPAENGHDKAEGVPVNASFTANVWEVLVKPGDVVEEGQTLVVLEAMKMETRVSSPVKGKVASVAVSSSQIANQGDALVYVSPDSPEE